MSDAKASARFTVVIDIPSRQARRTLTVLNWLIFFFVWRSFDPQLGRGGKLKVVDRVLKRNLVEISGLSTTLDLPLIAQSIEADIDSMSEGEFYLKWSNTNQYNVLSKIRVTGISDL